LRPHGTALDCTPWPPEFAEAYRRAGYWRGQTLGDLLHNWARAYADSPAVVSGGERISYRSLAERADRLAVHLRRVGIGRGDRVVVQLPNIPEFLYLCFALFRLGALPVLALPAHREHEIAYLVEISAAVAYAIPATFRGFDYLELAWAVKRRAPALRHVLLVGDRPERNAIDLRALIAEPVGLGGAGESPIPFRPDPSDVAFFLLSGGTTGLPKLIPRTHNDYAYNFRASAALCRFSRQTRYLVALPIGHNFPLGCPGALGTLQSGGTVVLTVSVDPDVVFPVIERERVTATALVPALAIRWLDFPQRERYDLTSLELLQVGGARLKPEIARRIRPVLGGQLQQVYGTAEGLINYTRLDDPEEVIIETQGRPLSTGDEVRVVDDRDRPVPAGQPGQLLARGPYTIRGYYRAEEHNRRAFTADGFYRMGDVVRFHPSGNLVVEGRVKDLINRGGEKISAEEMENLILGHPNVFNVTVVAMPDPLLGERICAYVIPRSGARPTLEELRAFLEGKGVARFKLPERLEVTDSFPLTSVGKINKMALREDIARKLRADSVKV
jgi:2,3-dihydroxybenzoate-AMP ligase